MYAVKPCASVFFYILQAANLLESIRNGTGNVYVGDPLKIQRRVNSHSSFFLYHHHHQQQQRQQRYSFLFTEDHKSLKLYRCLIFDAAEASTVRLYFTKAHRNEGRLPPPVPRACVLNEIGGVLASRGAQSFQMTLSSHEDEQRISYTLHPFHHPIPWERI